MAFVIGQGTAMTLATPHPTETEISAIIEAHLPLEGPLLPMLHALQEAFGHVPAAAHAPICDALNITKAELQTALSASLTMISETHPAGRQCGSKI